MWLVITSAQQFISSKSRFVKVAGETGTKLGASIHRRHSERKSVVTSHVCGFDQNGV